MKFLVVFMLLFSSSALAQSEKECLALNIYFEGRNTDVLEQITIAFVVLNRVENPKWPDTICKVIKQGKKENGLPIKNMCQFSWYCDGKSDEPKNIKAWNNSLRIAEIARKWYKVGEDFSNDATFYHAKYAKPYWAEKFTKTLELTHHIFYTNQ